MKRLLLASITLLAPFGCSAAAFDVAFETNRMNSPRVGEVIKGRIKDWATEKGYTWNESTKTFEEKKSLFRGLSEPEVIFYSEEEPVVGISGLAVQDFLKQEEAKKAQDLLKEEDPNRSKKEQQELQNVADRKPGLLSRAWSWAGSWFVDPFADSSWLTKKNIGFGLGGAAVVGGAGYLAHKKGLDGKAVDMAKAQYAKLPSFRKPPVKPESVVKQGFVARMKAWWNSPKNK